jgi:hypothetical protein
MPAHLRFRRPKRRLPVEKNVDYGVQPNAILGIFPLASSGGSLLVNLNCLFSISNKVC